MSESARGFPAFAPQPRRGRRLAATWWGQQWVAAVEEALLEHTVLSRGRRYAYAGQVGSITVSPGRLAAMVHDGDPEGGYDTRVRVARWSAPQWGRFLDQVAGRAGYLAALLERQLPTELATDAGVALLPELGEVSGACTCPDSVPACAHAAALGYQMGWLLDADPWLLLLLRGRPVPQLLKAVQERQLPVIRAARRARELLAQAGEDPP